MIDDVAALLDEVERRARTIELPGRRLTTPCDDAGRDSHEGIRAWRCVKCPSSFSSRERQRLRMRDNGLAVLRDGATARPMRPPTTTPLAAVRPMILMLVTAVAAFVVYLVLPPSQPVELIRVASPLVPLILIARGLMERRKISITPWVFLMLSMASVAAAHVTDLGHLFDDSDHVPSWSDAFHLAAAISMLVAISVRVQETRSSRDEFGMLEAAIVAIGVVVGIWLVLVEPFIAGGEHGVTETIIASLVSVVGALSFAVAFRYAAHSAFRNTARLLLLAAIGMQTVIDAFRAGLERQGEFSPGGLVAGLCIIPPLVIAAGSLHPSAEPGDTGRRSGLALMFGPATGVTIGVLAPVGALLVLAIGGYGTTATRITVSIAAVIAVALALVRMWRLANSVRALSERRGQDRLAALVEHSTDVVLLIDDAGVITYASPGLTTTLGHVTTEWVGRDAVDLVVAADRSDVQLQLDRLLGLTSGSTVEFETNVGRADGQHRHVEVTIANLLGGDAVDGLVATMRDVTDRRALERRLSHRAYYDELTGLANRSLFLDRLDRALLTRRPDTDPVVVLFVDLDDFKAVNDALGHAVGDRLLAAIADQIRDGCGDGDTPARLGGDEFALLLEGRGGTERAVDVAEQILESFARPLPVDGYELNVNASIGVAVASPGMTTSELLGDADAAMYEAKRAGKGQVKLFGPEMQMTSARALVSHDELDRAFRDGQLRLVYEPFVSLQTGRVLGAQALLRWSRPGCGDVPSGEFIPVAETTGLVVPLGRWILSEVAHEAASWQANGPLQVGIKIPPGLLRSSTFIDDLSAALDDSGLDPRCLVLGIPGDAVVDALDGAHATLDRLRAVGVLLAVADFGSGALSLVDLRRASVDVLRIDAAFVDDVAADSSVGRVLIETCATLGIRSFAAGVRSSGQLDDLRRLGCAAGQGSLFSPPLEVAEIRRRFGVSADGWAYAAADA